LRLSSSLVPTLPTGHSWKILPWTLLMSYDAQRSRNGFGVYHISRLHIFKYPIQQMTVVSRLGNVIYLRHFILKQPRFGMYHLGYSRLVCYELYKFLFAIINCYQSVCCQFTGHWLSDHIMGQELRSYHLEISAPIKKLLFANKCLGLPEVQR
jgi:hypothetical protein